MRSVKLYPIHTGLLQAFCRGDEILLNMPGDVTFDVNQTAIKPQFRTTLDQVAATLWGFSAQDKQQSAPAPGNPASS